MVTNITFCHIINTVTHSGLQRLWARFTLGVPHLYGNFSFSMPSSISDHDAAKACSETLLQKARDAAAKKDNYDSKKARHEPRTLFSERFGSGAEPYQRQLDVTEAIKSL